MDEKSITELSGQKFSNCIDLDETIDLFDSIQLNSELHSDLILKLTVQKLEIRRSFIIHFYEDVKKKSYKLELVKSEKHLSERIKELGFKPKEWINASIFKQEIPTSDK